MLVSALASFGHAQLYLNLETGEFSMERKAPLVVAEHEESPDHERQPVLDHGHDAEDWRYLEEERLLAERGKHFREVHHPRETVDFGSHQDEHRHWYPEDQTYHPREASEEMVYHGYHSEYRHPRHLDDRHHLEYRMPHYHEGEEYSYHHSMSNAMKPGKDSPSNSKKASEQNENVLDDDDPAICFVKAYARKPLGTPSKQQANGLDYWYDDDEDEYDYEPDEYYDYGNHFNYEDYSDSEDYYDEDEYTSGDSGDSSDDEDETSSEDEGYGYYGFDDELWNEKDSHYKHHRPQAQYFDLAANQEAPPTPTPAPAGGSDSEDSQDSAESEDDSDSSDANAYRRRRHPAPAHGHGRDGRTTHRHPTTGHQQPTRHAQPHPHP